MIRIVSEKTASALVTSINELNIKRSDIISIIRTDNGYIAFYFE